MASDPITTEVIWGAFLAATEEMGLLIKRSARSETVRESEDFSGALLDWQGRLVSVGVYTPGQLGSMARAVREILKVFPLDCWKEGDVVILNDPYQGGTHLPDIYACCPVIFEGQVAGFAGSVVHHLDVGGSATGSQLASATEIYQEGIRIPPVKLIKGGEYDADLLKTLAANIRFPDVTIGDLKAQIGGAAIGVQRYQDILRRFGRAKVDAAIDAILQTSEDAMRQCIRQFGTDQYHFEDYLDDYGEGTDPVKLAVTIWQQDGDIYVDFTGTDSQKPCSFNCPITYTFAYVLYAIKCITTPNISLNEGDLRPIHLIVPEGSFLNPKPPVAVGSRAVTAYRIYDVMAGALFQAFPHRVTAAPGGASEWVNVSGYSAKDGRRYFYFELLFGGTGARTTKDGANGMTYCANVMNVPIEIVEASFPVLVERYQLRQDSGGAGQYRGGNGIQRDLLILEDVTYISRSDRHRFSPYGLHGGEAGATGRLRLTRDGKTRDLHTKNIYSLKAGDRLSLQSPGGGGYGDPVERKADAIQTDLLAGYVSDDYVRRFHGAVGREALAAIRSPNCRRPRCKTAAGRARPARKVSKSRARVSK